MATAAYQYLPDISIDPRLAAGMSPADRDAWVAACPGHVFAADASAAGGLAVADAEGYRYDGECLAKAEELGVPGLVTIVQKQDDVVFRVEGTGALPAGAVVCAALELLERKLRGLHAALEAEGDE